MTKWDILLSTASHRNTVTVEENLLHNTFTFCYVYYTVKLHVGTEPCWKLVFWVSS